MLAGYHGNPRYVIETNLTGTVRCLQIAREAKAAVVFLSTSRVYLIAALNTIAVTSVHRSSRCRGADAAGITAAA